MRGNCAMFRYKTRKTTHVSPTSVGLSSRRESKPATGKPHVNHMSWSDREALRREAMRLLTDGLQQVEVARTLGVAKSTISAWKRRAETGGLDALRDRQHGRPPRLDPVMRGRLEAAVTAGLIHREALSEWPLARLSALVEALFDVHYSRSQVCRLRSRLLDRSPQPVHHL